MRIAFIHDWLVDKGGSENVLSAMLEQWPHAPVYTLVHDHQGPTRSLLNGHTVITSFLQKLPQATRRYRSFLPLMPIAIEQFDLSAFDIVISSSHAVAKGVIIGPDQLHISYVHSPIRYAWELQFQYLREAGLDHGLKSVLVRWLLHYIRLWDTRTANGVDEFVCNSRFVARRIWKVYHRKATVIYPPVDVDKFELCEQKENFYLTASRMVPYKRINLIVEAFAKMSDKRLFVIGNGPDFDKIKAIATPNVILMGYQPLEVLREKMQKAKAFIFAAEEDFGIVPVEAQACGTPVIAFGKGGALETIVNEKTGLFFEEQSVDSLLDAISRFETRKMEFSPHEIRKNAERFSKARFQEEFTSFVNQKWQDFEQRKKIY
jgi:glycosyltransferase involved in cell wall biosynthesis